MPTLRIAGVEPESIVDGPSVRYVIFTQGCPHHCKGCHNPQTWDFHGGREVTVESLLSEIDNNPLVKGVTFSGGEPFCQWSPLSDMACLLRFWGYNVMAYTGGIFEDYLKKDDCLALLQELDLLVDGPYIEEERSLELRFRGSRNQRIIDVQASLKAGKTILAEEYM